MAKLYWEKDATSLSGRKLAVLGYGSQGTAHALNLRDSGQDVTLGLRPGSRTWARAEADGWQPQTPEDAVRDADVVAFLVPDMVQAALYTQVAPHMKSGATLLFAHGFNVHYGHITPPADCDVVLVAPKSPGALVRSQYEQGRGVPCLIAVHQDASGSARDTALGWAHGLGGTRAGVLQTSFAEETETDLFGEQAVLCGGATELVKRGFETLVEAGYQPEIAYFECLHELKLIVDLLYEGGFARMHEFVSETAKWGDLTQGPRVIDARVKDTMRAVLKDIQDGTFAREWADEHAGGMKRYNQLQDEDLGHEIEKVGASLRSHMAWIQTPKQEEAEAFA